MVNFSPKKPDHQILNIAHQVSIEHPNHITILVTKDVNLRVKAKAIGLVSQDYKNDHVLNLQKMYEGCKIIEDINPNLITEI